MQCWRKLVTVLHLLARLRFEGPLLAIQWNHVTGHMGDRSSNETLSFKYIFNGRVIKMKSDCGV